MVVMTVFVFDLGHNFIYNIFVREDFSELLLLAKYKLVVLDL